MFLMTRIKNDEVNLLGRWSRKVRSRQKWENPLTRGIGFEMAVLIMKFIYNLDLFQVNF